MSNSNSTHGTCGLWFILFKEMYKYHVPLHTGLVTVTWTWHEGAPVVLTPDSFNMQIYSTEAIDCTEPRFLGNHN